MSRILRGGRANPHGTDRATYQGASRSEFLLGWFTWWVRGYLAKHFHAVRLARGSRPQVSSETPLMVVLNHPSWWDPLVGLILAGSFAEHAHHAPMEARALDRYRMFRRLGFYGVEPGTARGARGFLQQTTAILSRPGTAVWITGQGRFADPRERPTRLLPGVAHVARRLTRGLIVPLALEYPFWNERLPEALARFGEPIVIEPGTNSTVAQWQARIEQGLTEAQDALALDAEARDPRAFETLLAGKPAIGGVYDAGRRLAAWLRGDHFRAEHGETQGDDA